MKNKLEKVKIARIWQGRVLDEKADEYEKYVYEKGIKIFAIKSLQKSRRII